MAELYLFQIGSTQTGFTASISTKTRLGVTYSPVAITRSSISITENFDKSPLTIRFPSNHWFAEMVLHTTIDTPIKLNIFKDDNSFWEGTIKSASKSSASTIDITCDSMYSTTNRTGDFPKLTLHCRHKLYSAGCGLDRNNWGTQKIVDNVSGNFITMVSIPETVGYYDNGLILANNQIRRIIKHNSGNIIEISYPFTNTILEEVTLYPGCSLTESTCLNTFNNLNNFGGWERMPLAKNPFKETGLL